MILAVDIGNSTISNAIMENGKVIQTCNVQVDKRFNIEGLKEIYLNALARSDCLGTFSDVVVSSVVPEINDMFATFSSLIFKKEPIFVDSTLDLGINILTKEPGKVGTDRLTSASFAHFSQKNSVIVIDIGTATTFDYINKNGDFLGGVIAPGAISSAKALYESTSALIDINILPTDKVIGDDTESAMRSGCFIGYIGLIENILSEMKREIAEEVTVIATGGALSLFKEKLSFIDIFDEHLVFKGLYRIYELNKI
ncbi:type III pantothenate kinase [Thermodesulfobacteriota bacterium]